MHQKSPLLVATPPQVTRALSRAYPWIRAGDYAFGLLTWTSGDPWESFIVVGVFWFVALYGGVVLRWAGNIAVVAILIAAMFLRRYSEGETTTTLDEILSSLNSLTHRVEIFCAPCSTLLNTLSSEKNATTATTRPKLTRLFVRILLLSPLWVLLSVYPLQLITPRRIVVMAGTLVLSWHSRPAKVSRTILWRSTALRALAERITGLALTPAIAPRLPPRGGPVAAAAAAPPSPLDGAVPAKSQSPGVKFTFALYENQRRWLGVGWTAIMFAYERAPWTDEHLQPCAPPDEFVLPATPAGSAVKWRWVPGEDWEVEGAEEGKGKGKRVSQEVKDRLGGPGEGGEGWWYYDNKWRDGRRGVDGWGKYTRRRKWMRRAELVEADDAVEPPQQQQQVVEQVTEQPKKQEMIALPPTTQVDGTARRKTPPPLPPREHKEILEEDARDSGSEDEGHDQHHHRRHVSVRVVDVDAEGRGDVVADGLDEHGSWHY